MAFELQKVTQTRLTHVNVRRELHGEEHVPAMDLSMRLEGGNELLDLLDPALRTSLYYNAAAKQGQESLPEVLAVLPNLRLAKLNGQKFTWAKGERHKGYRFVLDYGLGDGESNVEFDGCTVTGWRIETKEGGAVVLEWVVQYAGEGLTAEVRGKLTGLTDEPIHIQLFAPETTQIVKGKDKSAAGNDRDGDGDGEGGEGGDGLFGEGGEGDTPEKALQRAHGAGAAAE